MERVWEIPENQWFWTTFEPVNTPQDSRNIVASDNKGVFSMIFIVTTVSHLRNKLIPELETLEIFKSKPQHVQNLLQTCNELGKRFGEDHLHLTGFITGPLDRHDQLRQYLKLIFRGTTGFLFSPEVFKAMKQYTAPPEIHLN